MTQKEEVYLTKNLGLIKVVEDVFKEVVIVDKKNGYLKIGEISHTYWMKEDKFERYKVAKLVGIDEIGEGMFEKGVNWEALCKCCDAGVLLVAHLKALTSFLIKQQKGDLLVRVVGDKSGYPDEIISYRGNYWMIALTLRDEPATISDLHAKLSTTTIVEGYRGGTFRVWSFCPVWIADYGEVSDVALIDIKISDNSVDLISRKVEIDY